MGCGVSTEASHSSWFSFLQCCASYPDRDEFNEQTLAGPNVTPNQAQEVAQPVHRHSMTIAPPRPDASMVNPSSSRLSNEARPVSRRSGKWRKSLSLRRPSQLKNEMLHTPPATPVLPRGRSLSPLPDFSHLRTSQILDLSSTPWLLVRSIAENVPAKDGRLGDPGSSPLDLVHSHIVPLETPAPSSQDYAKMISPVSLPRHQRALTSPESGTDHVESADIPVPAVPQEPQEKHHPRPRANTAPTALSSKLKAKRKKNLSTFRKDSDVENAVQELRDIVDEKRGDVSIQNPASTLARSEFSQHVPAIAPTMKMPVGTELLADIGSAFSKPLADGNHTSTGTVVASLMSPQSEIDNTETSSETPIVIGHRRVRSTASRISNLLSSRSFLSSKTPTPPHHSGTFLLKTSTEALNIVSASPDSSRGGEIEEPHPSPARDALSSEQIAANKDRPASVISSISSSTISTSRFPTTPTTPLRSRAASMSSPPPSAHAVTVPPLFPLQGEITANAERIMELPSRPRTAPEPEIPGNSYEEMFRSQNKVTQVGIEQRRWVSGTAGLHWSEDPVPMSKDENEVESQRKESSKKIRKEMLESVGRSASLRRAREVRGLDSAAVGVAY